MGRMLLSLVALASVVAAVAPSAFADSGDRPSYPSPGRNDTTCTGALGPVVIRGNVFVPSGTCVLTGTQVLGSVYVATAASLEATGATVSRSLVCVQATCSLSSSKVNGDVLAPFSATFSATQSTIGGNLSCSWSSCTLTTVQVGGDVAGWTWPKPDGGGSFSATGSTVGGRLDCNATCSIDTTQVGQSVRALPHGSFSASSATINGDLSCGDAGCSVSDSRVGPPFQPPWWRSGGAVTVPENGTFDVTNSTLGSLECEDQATCFVFGLDGAPVLVRRDIRGEHATWLSVDWTTTGGDVSCDGCSETFNVSNSQIGNDLTSRSAAGVTFFCNNTVKDDVEYRSGSGIFDTCGGNVVQGDFRILGNGGSLTVVGNQIGRTLLVGGNRTTDPIQLIENHAGRAIQCWDNQPQPVGGANTAPRVDRACAYLTQP